MVSVLNSSVCGMVTFIGFLIPGASGNVSLFVALVAANMTMIAQARLSFRDIDPYVSNQDYTLTFTENILVQ